MNEEEQNNGSSKSNSVTSEHSLHSTGISAPSSQGSSTNSLPVHQHPHHPHASGNGPPPLPPSNAMSGMHLGGPDGAHGYSSPSGTNHLYSNAPSGFHRPQQMQMREAAAAGAVAAHQSKSQLSQVSWKKQSESYSTTFVRLPMNTAGLRNDQYANFALNPQ